MKKYVVVPGEVVSATDGQTHFIGAGRLMQLYRVHPRDCVVYRNEQSLFGYTEKQRLEMYWLMPRYDGCYAITEDMKGERTK